mmetsp:Transcript_54315/g.140274  ORF Transcript_54315/g.140274 Transcript_54315/m.140274 type:complete len:340 (-) Transcript_54315:200-1219(-)|eukprot:CAMPEP_0115855106 /NCGR_PEP_ID=MMETSP0287-20121206/14373_1 /TAXON_ID=412157 /ORGANISM="Chrysochromulina rotalis, Strain UIO044" /LENGTH=339 /DNA_ID=CAMNT_0003309253 /DNA_START=30 /DNA_END=1049 /DNA_ORIENTATION=-
MAAIQAVDFSAFSPDKGATLLPGSTPTEAQQLCANQIDNACRNEGFVYLKNIGLPAGLTDDMFSAMGTLFALPEEQKLRLKRNQPECNTGYHPFKGIRANRSRGADLCEGFNVSAPTRQRNDFGGCPPEFEPVALAFWAALEDLTDRYATALALAAGLPPTFFVDRMCMRDQSIAKMNHYPPCEAQADGDDPTQSIRIGEHTDFGCFTLLFLGAGATGLQIKPATGNEAWVDVPPPPMQDAVLVNTGALLARWTNDTWRATSHRVIVPDVDAAQSHRYSIACFCDPDRKTNIEVLPQFIPEGEQPHYPPVLAGEHRHQLLSKLLKPSSAESTLGHPTGD